MAASRVRLTLRRGCQRTEQVLKRLGAGGAAYVTWPIWKETRCLFVLSTGRTGTKTLSRLLDLSDKIDAFHEPRPQLLKERQSARWEVYKNQSKYRHIFIRSRGASLFQTEWRNRMYVETSARLTFFAPALADLLPNAKFLFVHRDPAGIIRSGMKRGWYVDHPADYARVRPVQGEAFFERWEKMRPFEKICWYWSVYNEFALDFCRNVNSSRILTIQSSNLFGGTAVSKIFDFLGARQPAGEDIERVLERKLNAQQAGTFPPAEEWGASRLETLQSIAGDTMDRLGYSVNDYMESSDARGS